MANNHNDGGAAFPRPGFADNETESQEGMTLRDYFAGQAVVALIDLEGYDSERAATDAYIIADAMIKARGE